MIRIENVTRKYGDFKAVDDVSITIGSGEIVGLLGHNGAGKTTIMKMITGYLEPSSGTITVNGRQIDTDRRQVQKEIGYLPENCPVYPEMTVIEYLDYMAALHQVDGTARAALVASAIKKTALEEKALQSIGTLSRGYRQRTGVAQAILHEPDILILDEPTNGLDPTQIQQMRALITELSRTSTVIVSTHILQEVQAVCDRVIILKNGRVALDSRLDSLSAEGRLLLQVGDGEGDLEQVLAPCREVAGVERLAGNRAAAQGECYGLTLAAEADRNETAALVAETLLDNKYRLYSMQFESRNLETVFAEISAQ